MKQISVQVVLIKIRICINNPLKNKNFLWLFKFESNDRQGRENERYIYYCLNFCCLCTRKYCVTTNDALKCETCEIAMKSLLCEDRREDVIAIHVRNTYMDARKFMCFMSARMFTIAFHRSTIFKKKNRKSQNQ